MSLALLLALFAEWSDAELLTAPMPRDVAATIDQVSLDQREYEAIAVAAVEEFQRSADAERLDRVNLILRLLLHHDGRSERGLFVIADAAMENSALADAGVNALAALASYYGRGGDPGLPVPEIVRRCVLYMANDDLVHNARECRRAVLARRSGESGGFAEVGATSRTGGPTSNATRIEHVLPSGDVLVSDVQAGLAVRIELWSAFDCESGRGEGVPLTEAAAERLQERGGSIVVVRYQDTIDADGAVTSSYMRSVERYQGGIRVDIREMHRPVAVPDHLRGVFLEDE